MDDDLCPACAGTLHGTIDSDGVCTACGHMMPAEWADDDE